MLEQLLIFTRGGLILWTCKELGTALLKGSPIDTLIKSCLLEDRSADSSFDCDPYTLKWSFHNDLGLVFVAVYQRIFHLLYRMNYDDFDETFRQLRREAESRAEEMRKSKQLLQQQQQLSSMRGPAAIKKQQGNGGGQQRSGRSKGGKGAGKDDGSDSKPSKENEEPNKGGGRVVVSKDNGSSSSEDVSGAFDVSNGGTQEDGEENRVWGDSPKEEVKLDFTDGGGDGSMEGEGVIEVQGDSMMDKEEDYDSSESEEEEEEGEVAARPDASKKKGWFSSMFQSIAGNGVIEKSDLGPALKALKDRLMTKNVAEEIAEKICESVSASLEGKRLGSFTRISSTVQTAMEEALTRILTPRRSIDILRDVHAAREQGKPYVIVFVGVNGVGKSTNLAKHKLSVQLTACDTFRSGAVEQLRTHARRLQIDIFEKGYEKDPAMVAKESIQKAYRDHTDVVLVDTAGRMQDKDDLMRELSKLINLNTPDLVLFVGEALVGNDAVDQLTKFNQKLADLSNSSNARLIDGILLTKFDTIDDKVGAALSMVYISGAPIMFVGCGQSYTDLKKLNVKSIVKTLLK
ncbi:hypothetical protein QJS10_CPB15g01271 [Acorus calamus]|uniref:SRP54-type proteins GTP-binding domain-containing protein n=1 Tax=Acorus calamus TaxID=4465 RepID=A0AAV9D6F3_ACOCL|nr:hypothetical protein QJS10_CPB15g01271 [Acorus calamus]